MPSSSSPESPLASHTISFRVRYPETDPIGVVHHSRFLQYFEMGRIELLRSLGHSYADLERRGVFFVVTKVEAKYRSPARFDDELTLTTRLVRATHVRFDHAYELRRDGVLLAEATTTIACVGRDGAVIQIPEELVPKG
jgi:acyl-CoA thioester hydrolase